MINNDNGAKHIVINSNRYSYFLVLKESDIETLKQAGLMESSLAKTNVKSRINYSALAAEYKYKIESGECSNRAELARSIGVSRAWVTKVMRRGTSK